MAFSTNSKPTIYGNLYENTGPGADRLRICMFLAFDESKVRIGIMCSVSLSFT